jgi:hypothetical protein
VLVAQGRDENSSQDAGNSSRNTEPGSRRFLSVTFFVMHDCYLPPASPCEFFLDGGISALIRCGTRKSPLRILRTSCQKD